MQTTNLAILESDGEVITHSATPPLRQIVKKALEEYLLHLEGHLPANLYELVLNQIEAPLFEVVMRLTKNNQSQAALLLGLSRGTLRKKLKQYNLDD